MRKNTNINILADISGFTLIEVMVAITILILVIIPLASFYAASLSTIQRSMLYSQALQLGRERIDMCEHVDYGALFYWNPVFTPGFELGPQINMNRDPDTTDNNDVYSYDPTDLNGDAYPIPIYRDYYDNSTGLLIDPNYNGLVDDDLDGDGRYGVIDSDQDDIAIACPLGARWVDNGISLDALPQYMQDFRKDHPDTMMLRAGDGLYDTVVEGIYANAFDPWLYGVRTPLRGTGSEEQVSPIVDFSLQVDPQQDFVRLGFPDYRHREQTFRTFARMTTILDPTPELADPNLAHPDGYTFADNLYMQRRQLNDGWTTAQMIKFALCTQRDIPMSFGVNNESIGVARQGFDNAEDYTQSLVNPFTANYQYPMYGKKVIVTVFFLSGEGEQEDLNGDGFPDGETFATSNNLRLERVFYNSDILGGSAQGLVPPVPRYDITFYQNSGHLNNVITDTPEDSDPCSYANDGLPYFADDWPTNL